MLFLDPSLAQLRKDNKQYRHFENHWNVGYGDWLFIDSFFTLPFHLNELAQVNYSNLSS